MPETVGREEDRRAFGAFYENFARTFGTLTHIAAEERQSLRLAFDAGMERGISKRGCLHPNCGECNGGEGATP